MFLSKVKESVYRGVCGWDMNQGYRNTRSKHTARDDNDAAISGTLSEGGSMLRLSVLSEVLVSGNIICWWVLPQNLRTCLAIKMNINKESTGRESARLIIKYLRP